jgi:hypothetical protein
MKLLHNTTRPDSVPEGFSRTIRAEGLPFLTRVIRSSERAETPAEKKQQASNKMMWRSVMS